MFKEMASYGEQTNPNFEFYKKSTVNVKRKDDTS